MRGRAQQEQKQRGRTGRGPIRTLRAGDRRGQWRRGLLRRGAAAALAGGAVWAATSALAPEPPDPGTPVVVAAHDIPVGASLGDGDLDTVRWPADTLPAGTFTRAEDLRGEVTNAPLRAGEPVTDLRVGFAATLTGLSGDLVLTHVPVTDHALAGALRPGTRVDVLSTVDGSLLAGDVLVTALSPAGQHGSDLGFSATGDADSPAGFYAAVTDDEAARLAPATGPAGALTGGVTVVLRPPDTPR
ncbi:Flp pilus assembly protein CpaB [Ornithinicoccus hortensis]|uniref:Flp pilus assembly protein CpaB n=1 Tax=Ornithinicoccus hortensis TaxID=82346 RepID=A0A542YVP2_9MICO|nr:Flp pilus assembly protein CpaB [Ornithinicoccus hortensis]TQL52150.1 Flp pilus assembly protein CpaB [Ornithinicoccus hortensis]